MDAPPGRPIGSHRSTRLLAVPKIPRVFAFACAARVHPLIERVDGGTSTLPRQPNPCNTSGFESMTLNDSDMTPQDPDAGGNEGSPPEPTPPKRSPAEVQEWMVSYLARHLNTQPDDIDVTVPFEHFALDSPSAIEMTGHLEDWLGQRVDPMMVYDYPTIQDMSGYLGGDETSEEDD